MDERLRDATQLDAGAPHHLVTVRSVTPSVHSRRALMDGLLCRRSHGGLGKSSSARLPGAGCEPGQAAAGAANQSSRGGGDGEEKAWAQAGEE